MVGSKNAILIAAAAVLLGSAAGLDFEVKVAPTPEATIYQSSSNYGNYFNATVDIKNPGSIGCEFRIKGEVTQGDQKITRYSPPYSMWPGEIEHAEFLYLPINYTGRVEANLSLSYCGKKAHIDSYSFNMSERVIPDTTIKSKTLEVNKTNALVSLGVEEARLIPQEYPDYWKVGSVKVENGRALIEYEPTLFRGGEEVVYTVIQNGTIEGSAEIVLKDQETWYEELIRKLRSSF